MFYTYLTIDFCNAILDPFCQLYTPSQTVPVTAYPWEGGLIPTADQCNASTPAYLTKSALNLNLSNAWLGPYNGALYQCSYEENIAVLLAGYIRW